MDLRIDLCGSDEINLSAVPVELLARIDQNQEVPCFISAPGGYGRTTLAHAFACQKFPLEDVLWLNGAAESFIDSLENNELPVFLSGHSLHTTGPKRLLVIDDLPLLDEILAVRLSDCLDSLLDAGWQVVITTIPLHDVFENLQSDRTLITGKELLASRDFNPALVLDSVQSFFDEQMPFEFHLLGMLMLLMQQGSIEDIRALGYRIKDDIPLLLGGICPVLGIDAVGRSFSPQAVPLDKISDRVMSVLTQASESGFNQEAIQGISCYQQLVRIASLLFDHGQKRRSHELLDLAGVMSMAAGAAEVADATPTTGETALGVEPTAPVAAVSSGWSKLGEPLPLQINLFGDLEILMGGKLLEDSLWKKGKARALLVHLVLNKGRGLSRDTIMEQLWPDMDIRHATDNFYVTWSRMCRSLSGSTSQCPYLISSGMLCKIDNRYVTTDVSEFERLSKQVLFGQGNNADRIEAFLQMEGLYRGDLLSGCIYDDLIGSAQQRYRLLLVDAMLSVSQTLSEIGKDNNALWFARKAYEIDPTREDVYRVLMDVQNRAGQRTSALQTYFACKKYLDEELGILPSQRTTALYQELILDKR